MTELCFQPFFLRIIYFVKLALNIMRFVVPIGLIVTVTLNILKGVIDPKSEDGKKNIKTKVIAAIIVFLIPSVINLVMSLIENIAGVNNYNGITECYEFANLDYIKQLEEEIAEEEYQKYLSERDLDLEKAAQYKLAIQKMVESNRNALTIGKNANNDNMIACETGSQYNTDLYNYVRSAGYKTREGVVAAALYLSSHIDVHIPYFWSGGHNHNYNGYQDYGENFMGVPDKWGCDVKMAFGGTSAQKDGQYYPFGIDCSGFISWAILNGGYYTGGNQSVIISTKSPPSTSLKGINVEVVSSGNAKGKIKPGDVAHKSGHVGMVVEVSSDSYKVAEAASYKSGLVIKEYKYGSNFDHIILMDNFYENYQKGEAMWNGFR